MTTNSAAVELHAGRRMAIRLNVLVAIVVAAALVVVANVFGAKRYIRRDVATLANYGLSERMKSVLASYAGEVTLSTLYMPNEEDDKQRGHIARLTDYCDELQRFSPQKVKVVHITTPMQREKLVASLSGAFGGEAGKHQEALDAFHKLQEELRGDLDQRLAQAQQILESESWLGDFPIFANIAATLKADRDALQKLTDEIRELTPAGGIPKFGDATSKAKTGLADIKTHLEAITRGLNELELLARETNKPDTKWIPMLREVADQSAAVVMKLRETVGPEGSTPSNVSAALKAFADKGTEVGSALDGLVARVEQFGKAFPMVRKHPHWGAAVQMGPLMARLEVSEVFEQASSALAKSRLVILGAIDSKDTAELSRALSSAQRNVTILEKNAATCQKLLRDLADRLVAVDPASKALLDDAAAGKLFAGRIKAIDELDKQITALPELKLAGIADRLKEDNTVVVEANGKIRVLSFNEVFPARESVAGSRDDAARTFNGDSAIASALLAMTSDKPVATAMLVSFEPPAPPQRNAFTPPPPNSWVPSSQLSEFRKRLEAANFKVVDWNLATTPKEPSGEEGVPKVYICLPPPPPAPPNPFGQQNPQEQVFGEQQREIIRKLLDADACVLFLATWEARPAGFFGGPPITPPYGYGPLLEKDWGIRVENGRRVVWVEPDTRKANTINIIPRNFVHMPAVGFTTHEIGAPMRGTRFLMNDACCLNLVEQPPAGVTIRPVLQIPERENYIGAAMSDLIYIIDEVQNPNSNGSVTLKSVPDHGPFLVMAAAERLAENKRKGRIVVCAFGGSIRDDFLQQPVWAGGDRLRLDSPPTENADLMVNALYWLQDKPQWIARGPAAVPRVLPIEASQARMLRVFVWGVWPAMVFAPGLFLWYIRRK